MHIYIYIAYDVYTITLQPQKHLINIETKKQLTKNHKIYSCFSVKFAGATLMNIPMAKCYKVGSGSNKGSVMASRPNDA